MTNDLWDVEWVDADGTPRHQMRQLSREAAERQAQLWLREKRESQVDLYRRRGAVTVLIQSIVSND